jgi:selenium metabolism protein YedF
MNEIVDARGLACPQPVILTRKAIAAAEDVTTIVDSATSRDNVKRMAEKAGNTVIVEEKEGNYYLHISKSETDAQADGQAQVEAVTSSAPGDGPLVLVIPDKMMGRGDPQLGEILIRGFFHTLGEIEPLPQTIIFFNAGVWLVIDDSPVLDDMKALVESGIMILACGTCLGHFNITDRLAVGVVSNMYDIAETMLSAGKVVTL